MSPTSLRATNTLIACAGQLGRSLDQAIIGRFPGSPAWHRNKRAARARARHTLKSKRRLTPSSFAKARLLLQQHHSARKAMPATTSVQCKACSWYTQISTRADRPQAKCESCHKLLPKYRASSQPARPREGQWKQNSRPRAKSQGAGPPGRKADRPAQQPAPAPKAADDPYMEDIDAKDAKRMQPRSPACAAW